MEDNLFSGISGNAWPIVVLCHQAVCLLISADVCPSAVRLLLVVLESLLDIIWNKQKNQGGE